MLLELIKVGSVNVEDLLSPSIDLTGDRSPEDLVEHGVGHIVVPTTLLVLGNGKCVLPASQRDSTQVSMEGRRTG